MQIRIDLETTITNIQVIEYYQVYLDDSVESIEITCCLETENWCSFCQVKTWEYCWITHVDITDNPPKNKQATAPKEQIVNLPSQHKCHQHGPIPKTKNLNSPSEKIKLKPQWLKEIKLKSQRIKLKNFEIIEQNEADGLKYLIKIEELKLFISD